MNLIIRLIVKLLGNFVPVPPSEMDKIQAEGELWAENIPASSDKDDPTYKAYKERNKGKEPNKFLIALKFHSQQWYVKLAATVLYVVAFKALVNYMRRDENPGDDSEI